MNETPSQSDLSAEAMPALPDNRGESRLASFPPKGKHLWLAFGAITLMYLLGVCARWWPTPDSALYQTLGRSLAEGHGFLANDAPCTSVTPGLPWILAVLQLAFGPDYLVKNLFMALCGIGSAGMIYLTIARLSDRRMALAVAMATAFSYTFYFNSHLILTDSPFTLLFWIVVYTSVRSVQGRATWLIPAALASAAAVTIRVPGGLVLGTWSAGLAIDAFARVKRKRYIISAAVVLVVIALAGLTFYLLGKYLAGGQQPPYVRGSIGNFAASNRLGQLTIGFRQLPFSIQEMFSGQDGFLPTAASFTLLAAVGAVVLWRRGQRSIAVVLVLYPTALILFGGWSSIRPRYLMPAQPMFVYAGLVGLLQVVVFVGRIVGRRVGPRGCLIAATVLVVLIMAVNLPKIGRWIYYCQGYGWSDAYYKKIRKGNHAETFATAAILSSRSAPDALIATDQVNLLHYLSRRKMWDISGGGLASRVTPDDARAVLGELAKQKDIAFVAVNTSDDEDPFATTLNAGLGEMDDMKLIFRGKEFLVYQRITLTTEPSE